VRYLGKYQILDGSWAAGATLLGINADSAFFLNALPDEYDIGFDLVSDMSRDAVTRRQSLGLPLGRAVHRVRSPRFRDADEE
jgi:peroxiredoxin